MITVNRSIDLYDGYLARKGRKPTTRNSYRRELWHFADMLPRDFLTNQLELQHYTAWLDRWASASPSTLASKVSLGRRYSGFLFKFGHADTDYAPFLERPPRLAAEDLDVVTVEGDEVERMLAACINEQELLCVGTAVYIGARRHALAAIRRGDVNLVKRTVRLIEKGGKVNVQVLPDEYHQLISVLDREGFWDGPRAYLIPNRRPATVRRVERSDKVIWNTVKLVAERAGVTSHVHALRAAYAVRFDEQHHDIHALKDNLGHARLETTAVYLRRRNKQRAKQLNASVSWGQSVFSSSALEAHTGFEPVSAENPAVDPLAAKLAELRNEQSRRKQRDRRR